MLSVVKDGVWLWPWAVLTAVSLGFTVWDLRTGNRHLPGMMKLVWTLTVLYSGVLGLAVYLWSGRRQIARDTLWRRACRSTAHCYSGCGLGEIMGLLLAIGVFSFGQWGVSLLTFALAYVFGFLFSLGPLLQMGEQPGQALWDTFTTETASITAMELTAIGVGMAVGGTTHPSLPLFWVSMIVSLSAGLMAAYPVNLALLALGIKSGMGDPREGA